MPAYDRYRSVRLVICFDLAIDQIAQSGLSSFKVIYYAAQLFSDEQHCCVYPISVVSQTMTFVTDSITTGRTETSGCFSAS